MRGVKYKKAWRKEEEVKQDENLGGEEGMRAGGEETHKDVA